ncbi:MAG: hypothetical protein K0Q99_1336 [Clostridia bacterium]|jgi:hypothetical protein|nr:hypothetical protein [Clostridia bacterium]
MNGHEGNRKKHMLHMALCCGLPILVIGLLPIIARYSPATGGVIGRIAPFLCPIMMVMMLPMMFRGNKKGSCCDGKDQKHDNNIQQSIE